MVGQRYAFFGVAAVFAGTTTLFDASGSQADAHREELRTLLVQEAEVKAELVAAHEAWRQTYLASREADESGGPWVPPPTAGTAVLARVQMRICELRSEVR